MPLDAFTTLQDTHTVNGLFVQFDNDGVWVNGQRPYRFKLRGLGKTADPSRLLGVWATIPTLDVSVEVQAAVLPQKGKKTTKGQA